MYVSNRSIKKCIQGDYMGYFANNVQVFEDTRHLSQNEFIENIH